MALIAGVLNPAPEMTQDIMQGIAPGANKGKGGRVWTKSKAYRKRHNTKGTKIKMGGKYIPAGPRANVAGTFVKNPAVAHQVNQMHSAWYEKKFGGQS
jgi:hypothetical protein